MANRYMMSFACMALLVLVTAGVMAENECNKACKDCQDDDSAAFKEVYGPGIGKCMKACKDEGGSFDCNHCSPDPCQNGGTCNDNINHVNGYSCSCVTGWTGQTCETDIDDCSSAPCQNGGTCTDLLNSHKCSCIAGWTGQTCRTDIDDCSSKPCQNGGTCIDQINGYKCSCAAGWTGQSCETNASPACGTGSEIAAMMKIGTKVVRGCTWAFFRTEDGNGEGTIQSIDGSEIRVVWDIGGEFLTYCMGMVSDEFEPAWGCYALDLAVGPKVCCDE